MDSLVSLAAQRGVTLSKRTARRYVGDATTLYQRKWVPRLLRRNYETRVTWTSLVTQHRGIFDLLVFSDEKLFRLDHLPRGSRIVLTNTREDQRRLRPQSGRSIRGVMVFGLLALVRTGQGASAIGDVAVVPSGADGTVTGDVYMQVLTSFVAPFMRALGPHRILLEDNASSHRACGRYPVPFERVQHGLYPAHSPDLNPIERLWAVTQAKARARIDAVGPERAACTTYQRKLIAKCFRVACEEGPGLEAIEWGWQNCLYAAQHDGRQRPSS